MDKIIFHGNIGKDAEYSEKDGRGMAKFTCCVNHRVKGEKVPEWRNITAFGKLAEICRDYAKKGRTVIIDGKPSAHGYKNKMEEIVASIDVVADSIEFVGGRQEGNNTENATQSQQPVEVSDEPLPF